MDSEIIFVVANEITAINGRIVSWDGEAWHDYGPLSSETVVVTDMSVRIPPRTLYNHGD